MTIYVNREQGYAVFNTAEINVNYRPFKDEICEAFLRGVNDFVIIYNSNNIIPIKWYFFITFAYIFSVPKFPIVS